MIIAKSDSTKSIAKTSIVGNSGTVGVGVGVGVEVNVEFWIGVGDGDAFVVDIGAFRLGNASGLGAVRKGTKFTIPKVKSSLKSYIV